MNYTQRHRDYPDKDYDSLANRACVSSGCRYRDYPDKDYNSLVTAIASRWGAGIFGRYCTFHILRESHQAGLGTEHLKNDIRECCYPGKRMRRDTTRRKSFFRRTYQREKAVLVFVDSSPKAKKARSLTPWLLLPRKSRCSNECFDPEPTSAL
jgi:hypothetical protein